MLALLSLLQQRFHWPAVELAERLEVTPRTVRRDVARLRSYGYPVDAFAGHGGGYQFGPGGRLPPLLFDDDETVAVALGLRTISYAGLSDLDTAALSALTKIEQLLPHRLRSRLDDLGTVTFADLTYRGDTLNDRAGFVVFARAAATRTVTRFDYTDRQGVATQRTIEPVQLVHSDRRWYVVGYDIDRSDWRVFRLDRSSNTHATTERFTERVGPDPTELVQRRVPADAFAYQANLRIECTADQARQYLSPAIAEITDRGDHCRVVIGTDDLIWLTRYLLGMPWTTRVIKPAQLRRMLHDAAVAIVSSNR